MYSFRLELCIYMTTSGSNFESYNIECNKAKSTTYNLILCSLYKGVYNPM